MTSLPSPAGFFQRDGFRAAVLIVFAAGSILLSIPILSVSGPPPKLFSFTENVPPAGSSIRISNVNGGATIAPWLQSKLLINGTVVVDGFPATPDDVSLKESNDNGNIVFQPIFPSSAGSAGRNYTVRVHVYFPPRITFDSVNIDLLGGANLQVTNLNASNVNLSTQNGYIRVANMNASQVTLNTRTGSIQGGLASIQPGDRYYVTTTKGGISLMVPGTGNFSLIATSMFGHPYASQGFTGCQTNYSYQSLGTGFGTFGNRFTATCGSGSFNLSNPTIDLNSENGDITISRSSSAT